MTMHTRTDTFFERCVTAFLSRLDFLGSPGNLTVLSCFKAELVPRLLIRKHEIVQ